uniref:LRRCT domain-containing protein n=1 Tax=Branchiostoma floridae TaxID=7739 RepID=C3YSZ1_BRAFL|eukprot:XP_002600547.1 hypothetical protein BRAFLDRAFT_70076 [Branchiostoma floridae]
MSNKARRMLVLLLIILKEAGPTAACSSSCSSDCDCSSRGLTSVPQDLPTDITHLNLENNAITNLSQSDFSRYRSLRKLDLDSNQISMIHNKTFHNLTSLTWLSLRYNKLTTLPADIFVGLSNLQTLYLNSNPFITLPADIFVGLGNLEILFISGNNIHSIEAGTFMDTTRLRVLGLGHNYNIRTIPADIFVGLGNLEILYLGGNNIHSIEAGTFSDTTQLRELGLGYNNIRTIPADIFGNLLQLEELRLDHNNIITPPLEALSKLNISLMSKLSLNNNQMETLPAMAYDILASVPVREDYLLDDLGPTVSIDNNPWQCDCRMAPFRQRMNGSYPFEDQIRCAGPVNLAGQLLRDVNPEHLICEETTTVYSTSNTKHVVDSTFRLSTVSNSSIHQSTKSTLNLVPTSSPTPSNTPTAGSNPARSTVSTAPLFNPSAKSTSELSVSSLTPLTADPAGSNTGLSTVSTDSSFTFQSTMTERNAGPTGSGIVLPVPVLALLCILPGLLIIAFGVWCMYKRRKRDHTAVPDPSAGSSNTNPTFYGQQQIRQPADINSQSEMTHGPGRDDSQHIYNVPNDDPDTAEYDTIAEINQPESPHQGAGNMQHLGSFSDGYEVPPLSLGPENGSHLKREDPQSHKYENSQVIAAAKDAAAGPQVIVNENDDEIHSGKEGPHSHKYVNSKVIAAAKDVAADPQVIEYENDDESVDNHSQTAAAPGADSPNHYEPLRNPSGQQQHTYTSLLPHDLQHH